MVALQAGVCSRAQSKAVSKRKCKSVFLSPFRTFGNTFLKTKCNLALSLCIATPLRTPAPLCGICTGDLRNVCMHIGIQQRISSSHTVPSFLTFILPFPPAPSLKFSLIVRKRWPLEANLSYFTMPRVATHFCRQRPSNHSASTRI